MVLDLLKLLEDEKTASYTVSKNMMPLDFYLENRLPLIDFSNLLGFIDIARKAADNRNYPFAMLGIGTSTYPSNYFTWLEKKIQEEGLTLDSIISEKTGSYETQFSDFLSYGEYVKTIQTENEKAPFDEQQRIVSEDYFNREKKGEGQSFERKISFREIINKKGEDLDFIVFPVIADGPEYSRKYNNFKKEIETLLEKKHFKYRQETSFLAGHHYFFNGSQTIRHKQIEASYMRETLRIFPSQGRTLHIYFDSMCYQLKIRDEHNEDAHFVEILSDSRNYTKFEKQKV
jgi:hypothetical protein